VKAYFQQHDIDYEEFDISQDMNQAQKIVEVTGQTGVPVTEIDGEFIIGFDKPRLAAALGLY
jgi:glutaredoxin